MTQTAPVASSAARWGRLYFALQALGGAAWWMAVFTVPAVCGATLGGLEPVPVAAADLPLFVGTSALAALGVRWAAILATSWTLLVATALAVYATVTGEAGWGVLIMAAAAGGSLLGLALVLLGRVPTEWAVRGPFAFRPNATGRSRRSDVLRTFAQIAVFWGLGLVVVPVVIRLLEQRWAVDVEFPPVSLPVGIVLLVLASSLGIGSAVVMSSLGEGTPLPSAMPHHLVVAGPYRWVRNPMAVAGIAQGVAVGLILSSWLVVLYAVAGAVVWNLVIRPHEEADLGRRFGPEFDRYRAAVRCWVPRLRPVRATRRR
ncbi:isoprenylcysteine carboxylmethyltransferase family protein [Herbiconiux sp. CPCC 203407]|uniref:Isoprenylcysteine carboxylmethyltransferase family protein n=1 Tax=Herbiconiux oxytropis TaxID=2970915 RepID=A0AA42BUQ0_9MICO|nr:isoprenylcysteine carboxylmethyltransferase family protein [Herbiconiux oxytropis]MCS5722860.1 isoprenylcysteine carboxylmethyltransferase family protein [Herbiconiux oxytropis]MCS5727790.1 isoprenylcysteine carboxylmethyltransferase family protein [Herbiconiux oxytropis]